MPRQKKTIGGTATKPDNNEARIVRVAERLFARRGYRNVTVRDIADAAHVTHPLIYYYFGSKRGLFAAVLARNQRKMHAIAERHEGARETLDELARASLVGSRTYQLILTRALAGGMRVSDWPGGFPAVETAIDKLLAELPEGHDEAAEVRVRELVVVAVAMASGWILLGEHLLEIAGLPPERQSEVSDLVMKEMSDVVEEVLPPGD